MAFSNCSQSSREANTHITTNSNGMEFRDGNNEQSPRSQKGQGKETQRKVTFSTFTTEVNLHLHFSLSSPAGFPALKIFNVGSL